MLGDGACKQVLQGHNNRVRAVTVCSTGKTLYSGGEDGLIIKWCTATGKQLCHLVGHTDVTWALVLSPDGDVLYSGSADCTIRAWDALTGENLHVIYPRRGWVRSLAVSPTGGTANMRKVDGKSELKLFTGSMGWFIEARSTAHNNQIVQQIPSGIGLLDLIHAMAVSDDGLTLFSGGTGCVARAWDIENGECLYGLEGHTDTIFSLCLSHNSTQLWSAAGDRSIRSWRLSDQQCLQVIRSSYLTTTICVSKDSRMLFTSPYQSGGVGVWNIDARVGMVTSPRRRRPTHLFSEYELREAMKNYSECDHLLKGHSTDEGIHGLVYSDETGRLYSAAGDCSLRAWQVGIPKKWSRALHSYFPSTFRATVREVLLVAGCSNGRCVSQLQQAAPDFNLLASLRALEPQIIDQLVELLAEQFMSEATAAK